MNKGEWLYLFNWSLITILFFIIQKTCILSTLDANSSPHSCSLCIKILIKNNCIFRREHSTATFILVGQVFSIMGNPEKVFHVFHMQCCHVCVFMGFHWDSISVQYFSCYLSSMFSVYKLAQIHRSIKTVAPAHEKNSMKNSRIVYF